MLCKPEQPELLLLLLSNSSEAYCVQYNGNKRASSIVALWQSSGCYANDICILRQGIKGLLICLGHLVIHKQCQCHTQCSLGSSSSSSYLVLAAPLFLLGCGYLPPHSRECMNGCRNPQLPRPLVVYTYSLFFSSLQQTWSPAKKGEHQHVSASSFREKPWHKSRGSRACRCKLSKRKHRARGRYEEHRALLLSSLPTIPPSRWSSSSSNSSWALQILIVRWASKGESRWGIHRLLLIGIPNNKERVDTLML